MLKFGNTGFTSTNTIFSLIAVLFIVVTAKARPVYLEDLPPKLKKCTVCHTSRSGPHLNSFGRDYKSAGLKVPLKLDSDHDGFTNGQELKVGTSPGDPKEFPGHKPFPWKWTLIFVLIVIGVFAGLKRIKNLVHP